MVARELVEHLTPGALGRRRRVAVGNAPGRVRPADAYFNGLAVRFGLRARGGRAHKR
jgi:hypothetical protein